jgi:hypothetical protein
VNKLERASDGIEFFRRAEAESLRYGGDPWVFFRELGQNSRDAFATRIDVFARLTGTEVVLAFADDGRGMTFEHARRYLFRLYASSKDQDPLAAGRYGVGFWSVLRFGPARLEVHSRTRSEAWGVSLSGDLSSWEVVECRRKRPGTTVVLSRTIEPAQQSEFFHLVETRLAHYLSHLRTAGRNPKPLRVFLEGRRLHRPFSLEGPGALAFNDGDVEGVVGFGPHPSYQLYARGLPVTQGAFLEELEGKRIREAAGAERQGAAPVYILNGNNLDVVLSRQTVLKDKALQRLVDTARRRFDELVSRTIDGAVKRSWTRKIADAFGDFYRKAEHSPAWVRWGLFLMTIFLLGGTLGMLASRLDTGRPTQEGAGPVHIHLVVGEEDDAYEGEPRPIYTPALRPDQWRHLHTGTVDAEGPEPSWALSYHPPVDLMFRLLTLERYDLQNGWQPTDPGRKWRRLGSGPRKKNEISIEMAHDRKGGALLLPIPTGYAPVGGSARAGKTSVPLQANPVGLVRARLPRGAPSPLRYKITRDGGWGSGSMESGPAGVEMPGELEDMLMNIKELPREERIRRALGLIRTRLRYDRSAEVARAYARQAKRGQSSWVGRVLSIGAGDCDVINGLLVLLLKRLDVPARLVVGVVGRDGEVLAGTHAWVEIDDGEIRVMDATRMVLAAGPDRARLPADRPVGFQRRTQKTSAGSLKNVLFLTGAAILAAALLLLAWGMWRSSRGRTRLEITEDARLKRGLLASMAADALRRPGAWMSIPGLWHRPFIPCLGGRFLSLARAIRLAYKDMLFIGRQDEELAAEAVRSKAWVLDRASEDFTGLFSTLSNLRDLDELALLKPVARPKGLGGSLLQEVNRLLRRGGADVFCRFARGEENGLCRDVDLAPIRPRRDSGWPRRFVAVFEEHPWWQKITKLYGTAPALAASVAIDRLVGESSLLKPKSASIRSFAAKSTLEKYI